MKKSEVFDNFIKIAEEKGLIPLDAPDKAKKKLENNPRWDSLNVKDIEKLYNVKPDLPKDMQYDRNIIQDAHPDSVIISPSYDKVHGLVENENERQNLTINILNKVPTGQIFNHRYAQQNLVLSLVRIANQLDNQNEEELTNLTDLCLSQLSVSQIKKQAIEPITMTLLIGIPALIGALYAHQHLPDVNEGLKKNFQDLLSEIDDLLNSEAHWYGTGYDINPQLKKDMSDFKEKLSNFFNLYMKIEPLLLEIQRPKDAKELMAWAAQPESQTVIKAYKILRAAADNILPFMLQVQKNFSSTSYKESMIEGRGWMTWLIDKPEVLHGGAGLIADDFDDIVHAIAPLVKSIQDVLGVLKQAESIENSAKQNLQQSTVEESKYFGPELNADTKNYSSNNVALVDQESDNLDKEFEELNFNNL